MPMGKVRTDKEQTNSMAQTTVQIARFSAVQAAEPRKRKRNALLGLFGGNRNSTAIKSPESQQDKRAAYGSACQALPKRPAKVEPKTLFANERTFMSWLTASILLVTLSSAMLSFGGVARFIGMIFMPVAVLFMLYSLFTYHWRLNMILSSNGSTYHDSTGPTVLTWLLAVCMICSFFAALLGTSFDSTTASLASESQLLLSHAERRYGRGCSPGNMTVDNKQPASWEAWEILANENFADAATLAFFLHRLEDGMQRFVNASSAQISQTTEHELRVEGLDSAWQEYRLKSVNSMPGAVHFLEVTIRNPDAATMLNAAANLSGPNQYHKLEFDTSCECLGGSCSSVQGKVLSVKSADLPRILWGDDGRPLAPGTTLDALWPAVEPFYGGAATLKYNKDAIFNTRYFYELEGLAGSSAGLILQLSFNTEEDQAWSRAPNKVKLSVSLDGSFASLGAIRTAEGLLEYLSGSHGKPPMSVRSMICMLAVAVFAPLIGFVLCSRGCGNRCELLKFSSRHRDLQVQKRQVQKRQEQQKSVEDGFEHV